MSHVDPTEYEAGKAAFRDGQGLREVVERLQTNDTVPYSVQQERKDLSFAVGFADAFIDLVRARSAPSYSMAEARKRGVLK
ncbi:MAG: hypothetical protein J0H17_03900 [Rhizobiales bacterium]|nr:hypothetical protein [Hyphomicrobiales bacterium]